MKFFNDISNFNNVSDYLPILNGILFVETFVIFFTLAPLYSFKNPHFLVSKIPIISSFMRCFYCIFSHYFNAFFIPFFLFPVFSHTLYFISPFSSNHT